MLELTGLVGVIGDVHCEDLLLERVLDYFEANRVSAVLCVGDIVDGQSDANRCIRMLQQAGVSTVRGNHDRWILEGSLRDLPFATTLETLSPGSLEMLRALPSTLRFSTSFGPLLLGHGLGSDDMAQIMPFDSHYSASSRQALEGLRASENALFVGGHTHVSGLLRFDNLTLINAGTLRRDQHPVCSLLDLDEGKWRLFRIERRIVQCRVQELFGAPSESVRQIIRGSG